MNAYNKNFNIRRNDGIGVKLDRDIHMDVHKQLGENWKNQGLLQGRDKFPRFSADNPKTFPRNHLGHMTHAERQVLREKGLYGTDARNMLIEKIQQNKTKYPELYDKGLFDPKNPPKY